VAYEFVQYLLKEAKCDFRNDNEKFIKHYKILQDTLKARSINK